METIYYKQTDDTPEVKLDFENDIYEISGKSMPEDVATFYEPIIDWLEAFQTSGKKQITFIFRMIYFNTASSKMLLDVMMKLENMKEEGFQVLVKWIFDSTDVDMKEAGEEFADIVDIPFEPISL